MYDKYLCPVVFRPSRRDSGESETFFFFPCNSNIIIIIIYVHVKCRAVAKKKKKTGSRTRGRNFVNVLPNVSNKILSSARDYKYGSRNDLVRGSTCNDKYIFY